MVYGIIGLINFAHGEVVMIGAMVALSLIQILTGASVHLPGGLILLAGVAVAIPVCMAIGYGMEKIAYRPLRNAPRLAPLITAIGVSIVLQNLALVIWGRNYKTLPPLWKVKLLSIGGATITDLQIIIILSALLMMAGLLLVVHKTRLGTAMRATAQNRAVAGLMGININIAISAAFLIGSGLAAVAGMMVTTYYGIGHYQMGFLLGLKAFTAAVLGGIGNLGGAMLGGILLGLIEALGAGYIGSITHGVLGSNYQDIFAFFVLIGVLILRPSGLLGERVGDRA